MTVDVGADGQDEFFQVSFVFSTVSWFAAGLIATTDA